MPARNSTYFTLLVLLLGCALLMSECGDSNKVSESNTTVSSTAQPSPPSPAPAARAAPAGRATPAEFAGTSGIVEQRRPARRPVLLRNVSAARHEYFDRVVFEFAGGVPGYHLEYIDRPVRQCGSGQVTAVAGEGWLRVRFNPARAHTEAGRSTVQQREFHPALLVLREVELVCDFEAQVEWVLGLAAPNHYRVLELRQPARLIVDIKH